MLCLSWKSGLVADCGNIDKSGTSPSLFFFSVITDESAFMDLQLITEFCLCGGMYGLRNTESHLGCDAASYGKWFFTFQRKMKVKHSSTMLGSTYRAIQHLVPDDQSCMS